MTVRDGGRIHGWWNQFHREIQRTGMANTRSSTKKRSSEKNSDLRSHLQPTVVSGGIKGQDKRHRTAPFTPPPTTTLYCALTTANIVIHRMTVAFGKRRSCSISKFPGCVQWLGPGPRARVVAPIRWAPLAPNRASRPSFYFGLCQKQKQRQRQKQKTVLRAALHSGGGEALVTSQTDFDARIPQPACLCWRIPRRTWPQRLAPAPVLPAFGEGIRGSSWNQSAADSLTNCCGRSSWSGTSFSNSTREA